MAKRETATTDPFAMDPWRQEPWGRATTEAFKFWVSFWPVAPLFGVEWRFAEMGRTLDPMTLAKDTAVRERRVAVTSAPADEPAEAKTEPVEAAPEPAAADDLTRIKGIGPGLARQLDGLGIRSFRQIAALSEDELAAVDEKLTSIKGGCFRDDWVGQAKALAG